MPNPSGNWSPSMVSDPQTGTIFDTSGNEHVVDFKTSASGHTLLADHSVSQGSAAKFDSSPAGPGLHDHYGSGNGEQNNGTSRGHYTGPGSK